MKRMTLVPAAILLHFDALTIVNFVLLRDVIATLAFFAGERYVNTLLVFGHFVLLTTSESS